MSEVVEAEYTELDPLEALGRREAELLKELAGNSLIVRG